MNEKQCLLDEATKVLLVDMDDTVLADGVDAAACWERVCQAYAAPVGVTPEELLKAIREYARWYWDNAERHRRGRLDLDLARREVVVEALLRLGRGTPALAAEIAGAYSRLRDEAVRPFPGALETLQSLRERGLRLGLVTNGGAEAQRRKIARFGLAPFFEQIMIEGEMGFGKPDERVFLYALEQFGVAAAEACMVGDNLEWDVAAPQRAGLRGIWIDLDGEGVPENSTVCPDGIIRSLAELRSGVSSFQ